MNEFKVFDVESGKDVTGDKVWNIQPDGKLRHSSKVADPDRYQVRRSTGISDKNGRLLFDGERVFDAQIGYEYKIFWDQSAAWFVKRVDKPNNQFCMTYLSIPDIVFI